MATILLLCWRDTSHPQGGGSEVYLERMGEALAAAGHQVFYRTALYPGARRREIRRGMVLSRGGGRLSVYPAAWLAILRARWGRGPLAEMGVPDLIIDTQNGVPFFAHMLNLAPTIIVEHHCHLEQWQVAGPGLAQLGWFLESQVSPYVHRHCRYITVSEPSRQELIRLGVPVAHIDIVRNGVDPLPPGLTAQLQDGTEQLDHDTDPAPSPSPRLITLARLVPHKQIEHAIDTYFQLLPEFPGLQLDIVGDGWWRPQLEEYVLRAGPSPAAQGITFHGRVSDERKHQLLAAAQVLLMPSRKEGWGQAVTEAAQHGVPAVGYRSSAGLQESISDGTTGFLVDSPQELTERARHLLMDEALCEELGRAAQERSCHLSWEAAAERFRSLIESQIIAT